MIDRLELDALRGEIAIGCRVLAARGLADGILGHISVRIDDDHLLVRCRGPRERGLAYTEPADIQLVDFAGTGAADGYSAPNELALHTAVLLAQSEARAVVHAHPPAVVAADLAGIRLRPIVGAFDIPGARLAAGGIPVYPRAVLIRTAELGAEMMAAMQSRPVVVLRGHGLTSMGGSVAEAVLRAISVDTLARLSLTIVSAGGTLADLPDADLALLPDLGAGFNQAIAWRHERARLGLEPDP
jgi:ribulose-5-phosphate 4-epimerase/fuculose-1-phosphate aldolase